MAMTRRRADSVPVKWMWLIFVTAFLTASSMAPALISPPSMCAMGIRNASATEAGASSSYRSAISKSKSGRICPRASARLSVATPMVFAIPTSVSELKRHSMRASIRNPSFSISRTVQPNSGDKCDPEHDDPQVDFRVRGEVAQRPVEVGIVSAGGGEDSDFPGHAWFVSDLRIC